MAARVYGRVVNVSSVAGIIGPIDLAAYGAGQGGSHRPNPRRRPRPCRLRHHGERFTGVTVSVDGGAVAAGAYMVEKYRRRKAAALPE
jgi:hypothetical protein